MSQEKVDRYKAQKANRKTENRKKKQSRIITWVASIVVLAAIVSWLGYSGYASHVANLPRTSVNANVDDIISYETGLNAEAEE